jgi:hypothetical protein
MQYCEYSACLVQLQLNCNTCNVTVIVCGVVVVILITGPIIIIIIII